MPLKTNLIDETTKNAIDPDRPLDVSHVQGDLYKVKSENDTYYVDLESDQPCDCPGQHFRDNCRHPRRVEILLGRYPLPKTLEHEYTDLDRDDFPTDKVRYE